VGRRPWLAPWCKDQGPETGEAIHTPAAPPSHASAIAVSGEMWILITANGEKPSAEPMFSPIHSDPQPQDETGHMWVSGGRNVGWNE
jgi:hypothetical protein